MKIHNVFHVSLLSPAREDTILGRTTPAPIPEMVDGEAWYEVERILDERVKRKKKEFLVRWKGYTEEEDSWEPAQWMEEEIPLLVEEFYDWTPNASHDDL